MCILTIKPISLINGTVTLPGSKSISNRVLLLSALSQGTTVLKNLLNSDDVSYMINTLKVLGIRYHLSSNLTCCKIVGNKNAFYPTNKEIKLFLGNAGTVIRPLTAVFCLKNNKKKSSKIFLFCEERMKNRPIGHLVDALRQGGANIEYLEKKNYPPLCLQGGFIGGKIEIDGRMSSQFLTALLMASPLAINDTIIQVKGKLVSKPYIDITLYLMKVFGIKVRNQSYQYFFIKGQQQYISPSSFLIEGDASSASYFLAAAAIKGGTVKVTGIGKDSIQGDIYFANILKKMGAIITFGNDYISCTRGSTINAIDVDISYIPDVAMTIAIVSLFAKGPSILRNVCNWKIKETDRLFAMKTELQKVGAIVKKNKNYICIIPPKKFNFSKINTYNDHRMAMCFSLLALSNVSVSILNPNCVTKTFPDYFKKLACISIPS